MITISLIAALGRNRVLGNKNALPWKLPADMKHFKELTAGKIVIMGRKTYESIGKPLPKRTNIVITSQDIEIPGIIVAHGKDGSWLQALVAHIDGAPQEVMVIGGASIYEQFLPMADRLYLTLIDGDFDGDAFFPEFERSGVWEETFRDSREADEKNPYSYAFVTYERKSK